MKMEQDRGIKRGNGMQMEWKKQIKWNEWRVDGVVQLHTKSVNI